jgi:hypothetical protein
LLVVVAGVAVGDGLRRTRIDGVANVAAAPAPSPASLSVCRGDVDGVVSAAGTVGVDTSSADGDDSVGSTDAASATVVVLGQFPARSTPEPYVGQRAWAHLTSDSSDSPGRVSGAQYDDSGGILFVAVALDHAPIGATDGDPATVSLEVGVSEDTMYVPTSLVHHDKNASWVQVTRTGATIRATVRVGLSGRGRSEILSGLRPDDELVVPAGASATCGSTTDSTPPPTTPGSVSA